jgi:hypothetical protein
MAEQQHPSVEEVVRNKKREAGNQDNPMKFKLIPILIAASLPVGCTPNTDVPMEKISASSNQRFSVERVGVFEDDLAYGNRRGIYIFTDRDTGKQYIGMSGIGISELGAHPMVHGKPQSTVQDER